MAVLVCPLSAVCRIKCTDSEVCQLQKMSGQGTSFRIHHVVPCLADFDKRETD